MENKKSKKLSDSLKLLIDYISDPVIVLDDEGKIAGVNKAMTHRSDYSVDAYIGKCFTDLDFLSKQDTRLLCENSKNRFAGQNIAPYKSKN